MMRDDVCIFFAMKCNQMVHAAVRWKLGTTLLGADLFRGYSFGASCRLFEYEVNFFEAPAATRLRSDAGPGPLLWNPASWARKLGYWMPDPVAKGLASPILRSRDRELDRISLRKPLIMAGAPFDPRSVRCRFSFGKSRRGQHLGQSRATAAAVTSTKLIEVRSRQAISSWIQIQPAMLAWSRHLRVLAPSVAGLLIGRNAVCFVREDRHISLPASKHDCRCRIRLKMYYFYMFQSWIDFRV